MSVYILQYDNREVSDVNYPPRQLWYFYHTHKINKYIAEDMGHKYEFHNYKYDFHGHGANEKIFFIDQFLNRQDAEENELIVFLDCDAWIFNPNALNSLLIHIKENDILGAYSRDNYHKMSSYVNTGGFILKNNESSRGIYKNILRELKSDSSHHFEWAYDQFYISNEIYKNKSKFLIFEPQILNTPKGEIIRHDWNKDEWTSFTLKSQLNNLTEISNRCDFDFNSKICKFPYPHIIDRNAQSMFYGWRNRARRDSELLDIRTKKPF